MLFYVAAFFAVLLLELFLLSTVILWHHALGWILLSALVLKFSKNERLKIVATNVAMVFLMILLLEGGLTFYDNKNRGTSVKEVGGYSKSWREHEKIGYGFYLPNETVNTKKYDGEKLVHESTYNFDQHGLRTTSHKKGKSPNLDSILFFGCSFTFGEAVNDEDSYPFLLIQKTKDAYLGLNFGFHGYGSHQMLALLEQKKLVSDAVGKSKVKYVFYEMIPDHIKRISGHYVSMNWALSSPRYELKNNEISYVSSFKDYYASKRPSWWRKALAKYVHDLGRARSHIIEHLLNRSILKAKLNGYRSSINRDDAELLVRIVQKSAEIVKQTYGAEFYTTIWDLGWSAEDQENINYIKTRFDQLNLKYFLTSEMIKDFDPKKYLIEGDGHPTGAANKLIADFLFKKVIKR